MFCFFVRGGRSLRLLHSFLSSSTTSTCSANDYFLGRSVEALLTSEDAASALSPPSTTRVADGEQLEGAQYTNIKQEGGKRSAFFDFAHSTHREPSAVMGASSGAAQVVPTMKSDETPPPVGTHTLPLQNGQRNVWSGTVATHGQEESCSGLFAQGAEASLLSLEPIQALNDEAEEERVGAEDWLEAVQAIDLSDTSGALG